MDRRLNVNLKYLNCALSLLLLIAVEGYIAVVVRPYTKSGLEFIFWIVVTGALVTIFVLEGAWATGLPR